MRKHASRHARRGLTFTSAWAQQLPTTGTVNSRLGKLELNNGFPTEATVKKLYDDIDFQRASQAYLWGLPLIAMVQWQANSATKFGAGNLDYVDYLTFKDKLGLLTANATTPYVMAFPNMKDTGPLVVEVPAGAMAGGIVDFWQRPLTDTGQTGPDKGAGGKYLVLGPDDPDMKPEGYYVVRSPTVNIWSGHRALDPDPAKAKAAIAGLRIYPYSQRDNPPPTRHVSPDGRKWSGEQPRGLAYWEALARVIDEEPVLERDRIMLGMLQPLGIEKGKPFQSVGASEADPDRSVAGRRTDGAHDQPGQSVSKARKSGPASSGRSRCSCRRHRRKRRTTRSSTNAHRGSTKRSASPSA